MMYNIRNGAIRWQIHFCLMVMFALSLSIYEIFANQIKRHKFDLENEDQDQGGEKRDLRNLAGNVRFHIGDFFRTIATRQHTFA